MTGDAPNEVPLRGDGMPADPNLQEIEAAKKRGYGLPAGMSVITAYRIAALIPNWAWRPVIRFAAWLGHHKNYRAVRQWRLNATVMMGREPTTREVKAGVASWLRNLAGSVRLGRFSQRQILQQVSVDAESERLMRDAWSTTGAIVALPHMGDWDLSGAWACACGIPVSSVAERLPDAEFDYFMKVRSRVGMKIYSHKDTGSLERLAEDLKNGHLIALVSDRDLSRHSIPVVWNTPSGPQNVTMPPGPAILARKTGAALLGACSVYTKKGIALTFYGPIEVDMGENGVAVTCQRIADLFARVVAEKPTDWHVMQRFFPGLTAE